MTRKLTIPASLRALFTSTRLSNPALIRELKTQPVPIIHEILRSAPAGLDGYETVGLSRPPAKTVRGIVDFPLTPNTNSLADETKWTTLSIERHALTIGACVRAQRSFERALLLGDYSRARDAIDDSTSVGTTLWSVGAELALAEARGGLSENRAVLQQKSRDIGPSQLGPVIQYILNAASQRVETAVSGRRFLAEAEIQRATGRDVRFALAQWVQYIIAPALLPNKNLLVDIIWLLNGLPPYDEYRLFCSLVKSAFVLPGTRATARAMPTPGFPRTRLLELFETLPDSERDPALVQLCGGTQPQTQLSRDLSALYAHYDACEYQQAASASEEIVKEIPNAIDAHLVSIKSRDHLGQRLETIPNEGTQAERLYRNLRAVVLREPDHATAMDSLLRLALALDHSPTALSLFGFLANAGMRETRKLSPDLFYLAMPVLSPAFSSVLERRERRRFLSSSANSASAQLRTEAATPDLLLGSNTSMEIRRLTHLARDRESAADYNAAISLYDHLLGQRLPRALVVRCTLSLHRNLIAARQVRRAAELVAAHLAVREQIFDEDAVLTTARALDAGASPHEHMVRAILLRSAEFSRVEPDRSAVYDAIDDVLVLAQIEHPSGLLSLAAYWQTPRLANCSALFLSQTCSGDVLDSSHMYESIDALEAERTLICRSLLAPQYATPTWIRDLCESELNAIALARFRRRAARELRQSRIFVDKPGLRRVLDDQLSQSFARFRAFSLLDISLRRQAQVKNPTENLEPTVILFTDISLLLFEELFQTVRDYYVSNNDHGLDSYLSVRLRHGTLVAELRSPFELAHLVTKREPSGEYAQNHFFLAPLIADNALDVDQVARVDARLKEFSVRIDATIERVRAERIRVRSDSHPGGMFDFDFSTEETSSAWAQTVTALLAESGPRRGLAFGRFFEACMAVLDARTNSNLARIREFVTTTLASELTGAIDDLRNDLQGIDASLRSGALERHALEARTTVANRLLYDFVHWFDQPAVAKAESFTDSEFADLVQDLARTQFPNLRLSLTTEFPKAPAVFDGTFLPALVDVVQLLLGNAAKHSRIDGVRVRIELRVTDDHFRLSAANDLGRSIAFGCVDAACVAIREVMTNNAAADMVRHEGGSGYSKLAKLLRHDLRCADFGFEVNPNKLESGRVEFEVTVVLSMDSLRPTSEKDVDR